MPLRNNNNNSSDSSVSISNVAVSKSFVYKSSDHLCRSFECLNEMRMSTTLCDVCLIAGSERIFVHRLVLAACSNYFRVMFTGPMLESHQDEVKIMNIDAQTLNALIGFFYTGEIVIVDTNVQLILPAACLLQVVEVEAFCCEFLKKQLHSTNCLGIRSFADAHTCKDLFKSAEKYILANFQDVLNSEEFFLLTADQLSDIIARDELNVQSEDQVYNGVMNWVNYDKTNRVPLLSKVLENVRLALFDPEFLVKTVGADSLIKADLACRDLLDDAKNYLLLRENSRSHRTRARRPLKYGQLLYAVGGWCNGDALSSVERMDTRTSEWQSVASMSKNRCGVGVAVLDDFLYAVGGHDGQKYLKCVERYDPRKNIWTSDVSPTSTCRTSVGVAVHDGALYAVGGQDGISCLNIVERYDSIRNEWKVIAPMNSRRLGVSVSVLDGQLYAVGGAEGQLPLDTVERYDPRIDKWYYVHPMNTRRKHLGTTVYNNHLYAIGGRADTCELSCGERYDPVRNEWTPIAPMNSQRSGVALAVVDNQMYAVGGFDGCSYLKSVEVYEENNGALNENDAKSATDHWCYSGSMSYRRLGGGVGVISLSIEDVDDFSCKPKQCDPESINTISVCLANFGLNLNCS